MLLIDNEFIGQWRKLIYMLLKQRGREWTKVELDDLYVQVVIKMMENAHYYKSEHAIGTWVGMQVRSAVAECVKKEVHHEDASQRVVDSPVEVEAEEESDEETDLDVLREQVSPYLSLLDETERRVFIDRVWFGKTVEEVGEAHGLHPKSVSRLMTRVTQKLTQVVSSGKRLNPSKELEVGIPLKYAIMKYDDAHYHAFRMHHFEGMPYCDMGLWNGFSTEKNMTLVKEVSMMLKRDYGVKI